MRKKFKGDTQKEGIKNKGGIRPLYELWPSSCALNDALSHSLYRPFQVLNVWIWLTPSFVYFNCFCIPEISITWITVGRFRWPFKFSDKLLCPSLFELLFQWEDYNIMTKLTLKSSRRNWFLRSKYFQNIPLYVARNFWYYYRAKNLTISKYLHNLNGFR